MATIRNEEYYEGDRGEVLSSAGVGETLGEVLARRLSRRGLVRGGVAAGLVLTAAGTAPAAAQDGTPVVDAAPPAGGLTFAPITLDAGDELVVAEGHTAVPFLRWGDAIFPGAPEWDIANQSAAAQERQFGYNCDWIAFFPLPQGSTSSDHGLLVVNNEYTNPELMFPGYLTRNPEFDALENPDNAPPEIPEFLTNPTQEIVDIELAAHGLSIVEVRRDDAGQWAVVLDSPYNRRITGTTPIDVTGPAAGINLMQTSEDPSGTRVLGTLNNCAGGMTPWGTALTGEENFHQYFGNLAELPADDPIRALHERYGLLEGSSERRWEAFHPRFDLSQEPNEPFRFGWIVEFDPYDPASTPKKRTAMGRNKHEGATSVVAPGGQVVFYSGDDQRFDYAYKFVTASAYNPDDRAANADLLDEGTLSVARFNDDGTGEWLPLVFGEGPLTPAFGFGSQGDVVAKARLAADLLGATKMDRPEDFETNPKTGKVYLVLTNNDRRTLDDIDLANPRPNNFAGHIIEITEDGDDHASASFTWDIFILAGDPADSGSWYGGYAGDLPISPFAAPDNLTFDSDGNIWISTDGMPDSLPGNDGLFVATTEGEERGRSLQFFSTVPGAECSGPVFNPDNSALWVSVQHPGEEGSLEEPRSLWPDGAAAPRPSVVLITADDPFQPIGRAS